MDSSRLPMTRRRLLALGAGTAAAVAVSSRLLRAGEPNSSAPIRVDPRSVYDPIQAGEQPPDGYWPIYGRDFIRPIYDPRFVGADEIGWPDDADVIGVEVDGDARAYPVGFLTGREMVIDEIAKVPILVTW